MQVPASVCPSSDRDLKILVHPSFRRHEESPSLGWLSRLSLVGKETALCGTMPADNEFLHGVWLVMIFD